MTFTSINTATNYSVHTLAYYDITLITEGKGHFSIDLQTHHVEPHDIIFTRPGEIRQWDKDSIREGLALLFEEEFLVSFFNDLLHQPINHSI